MTNGRNSLLQLEVKVIHAFTLDDLIIVLHGIALELASLQIFSLLWCNVNKHLHKHIQSPLR